MEGKKLNNNAEHILDVHKFDSREGINHQIGEVVGTCFDGQPQREKVQYKGRYGGNCASIDNYTNKPDESIQFKAL